MVAVSRNQLNSYFVSEMEALRDNAAQFGERFPNIAAELSLSRGRSRDPHVEHLLQSFAWMHSRLRLMVESESSKLPTILLQQLYPQLVASTPSMSIAQFEVPVPENAFRAFHGRSLVPKLPLPWTSRAKRICPIPKY